MESQTEQRPPAEQTAELPRPADRTGNVRASVKRWLDFAVALGTIVLAAATFMVASETRRMVNASSDANKDANRHADSAYRHVLVSESLTREATASMSITAEALMEQATLAGKSNALFDSRATEERRPWVELHVSTADDEANIYPTGGPQYLSNSGQDTFSLLSVNAQWSVRRVGGGPARSCIVLVRLDSSATSIAGSDWLRSALASADTLKKFPVGAAVPPSRAFQTQAPYRKGSMAGLSLHVVALVWPTAGVQIYYYEQTYCWPSPIENPGLFDVGQSWHGMLEGTEVRLETDTVPSGASKPKRSFR
jgi:hypothetical protein